jgi:hypothetical protein
VDIKEKEEEKETVLDEEKPVTWLDMIKDLPGAPNQVIIDEWKAKYGEVFFSGFSEKECYIWRALTRREYREMQIKLQLREATKVPVDQKDVQAIKARVENDMNETFSQEEETVSRCLLWPKLTPEELTFKAGTVPTLLEQIMQNSNFTTPQQAQMLVIRI